MSRRRKLRSNIDTPGGEKPCRTSAACLPLRPWLLAAMTALFVSRPLLPSEGVAWVGDGQPYCLLWLLLALVTSLMALKGGSLPRRFGWIEVFACGFTLLHAIAAWRGAALGNPRPTLNMLWEGVAMVVSFLIARQLIQTAREARALVAAMVALTVALSVFGYYQVLIGMPADRLSYSQDPDETLRRAGQWFPPGSPERLAFESRLSSSEPLATFALTNSLAGFLATWFVVGLAMLRNRKWWISRTLTAAYLAAIAVCLILTKSRSAIMASFLGILLLLLPGFLKTANKRWKLALVTVAAVVTFLLSAFLTTEPGRNIYAAASKSFHYRVEYWKSTTQMIADRPVFGVGPGNFQDIYTQYKLPEASEEVRDPHNWVFEIAATAGLPALAALLGIFSIFFYKMVTRQACDEVDESVPDVYVYSGSAAAIAMAFFLGSFSGVSLGIERTISGLVIGGGVLYCLTGWVKDGKLSPSVVATAVFVMLVNLMAAGGFMYPGVVGSLWLLLAIGLNLVEQRTPVTQKTWQLMAVATSLLLVVAQYLTGYLPVLRAQGAMLEAINWTGNDAAQEQALILAAEFDPRAAEPWQELAALRLRKWLIDQRPLTLQEFRNASDEFLLRRPMASSAHRLVAKWWREIYDKSPSQPHARKMTLLLSQARDNYPHHPGIRAELALAMVDSQQPEAAKREAAVAIALDEQTPHADKKLSAEMRQKLEELLNSRPEGSR